MLEGKQDVALRLRMPFPLSRSRRCASAWRRLAVALAVATGAVACAPAARPAPEPPPAPDTPAPAAAGAATVSPAFQDAFTAADTRARAIVYWLQCVGTVARLRTQGTFGAAAAAPRALYCERTSDGVPVGGVYDIDSSYRTVRRLALVRLDGARPRYAEPIDTARIARQAKLARDVSKSITPAWTKRGRPFTVVPVTVHDTTEAWVLPRATKARSVVSGGDIGYTANADGTLRALADRTSTWTQLALPATGRITIYSSVRDVPAIADLVTARWHTELGREVVVSTPAAVSALVAGLDSTTGARLVWKHSPRP
jgi:hypothetical protein